MREILFKAKRIDNDEWVEGYLYIRKDGVSEINYYNKEWDCERYTHEVDSDTICQYTGLTDKNDNNIWENDIVVTYDYHGNPMNDTMIIWNEFGWYQKTIHAYEPFSNHGCVKLDSHYKNATEVIGNVFDNGELLKG